MSTKRKYEAIISNESTLREFNPMRSPNPQAAAGRSWEGTPVGYSAKPSSPKSKIAHRLDPSFVSPKPSTPLMLGSRSESKPSKETNDAKFRRISAPTKLPSTSTTPKLSSAATTSKLPSVATTSKLPSIGTSTSKQFSNVATTSSKSDKSLSTIVKAKNKQSNGLPVAWRAELYGTRPGSAQSRLENLRATLHKEVEEQKMTKPATKMPMKRTVSDREGPPSKKPSLSISSSRSSTVTSFPPVSTVPLTSSTIVPGSVVANVTTKPLSIDTGAVTVTNAAVKPVDDNQMDVDDVEMHSPVPLAFVSPAAAAIMNPHGMECENSSARKMAKKSESKPSSNVDSKKDDKGDTNRQANDASQKTLSELKTKYKDGLTTYSSYFYCVIDTNIFIEHYQDFQNFLSKKYKGRQPIVIIPYKVLHELDTVKHKKPQLASKIIPVVKFLHKMLRAKDPRVKGQHPWDDTVELMPLLSPDDSIVNCALQVQMVAAGSDVQVVLVSNDCNMLTKALVANLNSCTMEELQSDYNF